VTGVQTCALPICAGRVACVVPTFEGDNQTRAGTVTGLTRFAEVRHVDRLLLVARYSGDDETGALDRQKTLLGAFAAEHPDRVMANGPDNGWVIDETVSGSVNLDERKKLGQWLREPLLSEWDTMVVPTQDRVTRDDIHWWRF